MICPNEGFGGPPLESSNQFAVLPASFSCLDVTAVTLRLPLNGRLNRAQALNLAAWLVAIVDPTGKDFLKIMEEIKKQPGGK